MRVHPGPMQYILSKSLVRKCHRKCREHACPLPPLHTFNASEKVTVRVAERLLHSAQRVGLVWSTEETDGGACPEPGRLVARHDEPGGSAKFGNDSATWSRPLLPAAAARLPAALGLVTRASLARDVPRTSGGSTAQRSLTVPTSQAGTRLKKQRHF